MRGNGRESAYPQNRDSILLIFAPWTAAWTASAIQHGRTLQTSGTEAVVSWCNMSTREDRTGRPTVPRTTRTLAVGPFVIPSFRQSSQAVENCLLPPITDRRWHYRAAVGMHSVQPQCRTEFRECSLAGGRQIRPISAVECPVVSIFIDGIRAHSGSLGFGTFKGRLLVGIRSISSANSGNALAPMSSNNSMRQCAKM